MSILTRIANTLFTGNVTEAYTTVVYPTRGRAVIVHDGLGVKQQRPWYESLSEVPYDTVDKMDCDAKDVAEPSRYDSAEVAALSKDDRAEVAEMFSRDESMIEDMTDSVACFSPLRGSNVLDTFGTDMFDINPANGLPMLGCGVDVGGNAFGFSD